MILTDEEIIDRMVDAVTRQSKEETKNGKFAISFSREWMRAFFAALRAYENAERENRASSPEKSTTLDHLLIHRDVLKNTTP